MKFVSSLLSSCVRLFLLGVIVLPAAAADTQPAPAPAPTPERVYELPPITVTGALDMPEPEHWYYAKIDGFEVLSNASKRFTKDLLNDFQKFKQALDILQPRKSPDLVISTIILCGRGGKFDDFTPDRKRTYDGNVSLSLSDREHSVIVLDIETKEVFANDLSRIGDAGGDEDDYAKRTLKVDHYRQLYRTYIHQLLARSETPPPPWLLEGISQCIMKLEHHGTWINYGKLLGPSRPASSGRGLGGGMGAGGLAGMGPGNMNPYEGSGLSAMATSSLGTDEPGGYFGNLQRGSLMPMDKFFAMPADAEDAKFGTSRWAKQAYAFVHMCLFSSTQKFQKPYATFVKRLVNEPLSEGLFKECFGMSYTDMEKELRNYIKNPRHLYRHIELSKENRLTGLDADLRDATEGEIGAIKGNAQRLAGRYDDAMLTFRVAYARGARDPRLCGALGTEQMRLGNIEVAGKFLEPAAKMGNDRPSDYVSLARLRFILAGKKPEGSSGKLSEAQTASVLTPLLKARTLKPALPETYLLMADAWKASVATPTEKHLAVIGEGVIKFPFNSELTYKAAQLYVRTGDIKNARDLAQMGLRFAADDGIKARFKKLADSLPAPAAATPEKESPAASPPPTVGTPAAGSVAMPAPAPQS